MTTFWSRLGRFGRLALFVGVPLVVAGTSALLAAAYLDRNPAHVEGAPAAAESEKRALIDRLGRPSGKSEEEKIQLASTIIQRAVRNGLTEVQVYRFPNSLCTDKGRAINQQEAGWENTLTWIPKEIFQLWADYLKPRGYRISYQIIDYPGGIPGDIAITIAWGD